MENLTEAPGQEGAEPEYRFLLYRTAAGKYILKLEDESATEEFATISEVVAAVQKLNRLASLTAYGPLGHRIMEMRVDRHI